MRVVQIMGLCHCLFEFKCLGMDSNMENCLGFRNSSVHKDLGFVIAVTSWIDRAVFHLLG
jgi:hypothetical protein